MQQARTSRPQVDGDHMEEDHEEEQEQDVREEGGDDDEGCDYDEEEEDELRKIEEETLLLMQAQQELTQRKQMFSGQNAIDNQFSLDNVIEQTHEIEKQQRMLEKRLSKLKHKSPLAPPTSSKATRTESAVPRGSRVAVAVTTGGRGRGHHHPRSSKNKARVPPPRGGVTKNHRKSEGTHNGQHGGYQRGGYQRGGYQRGGYQRGGYQRGGYQRGGQKLKSVAVLVKKSEKSEKSEKSRRFEHKRSPELSAGVVAGLYEVADGKPSRTSFSVNDANVLHSYLDSMRVQERASSTGSSALDETWRCAKFEVSEQQHMPVRISAGENGTGSSSTKTVNELKICVKVHYYDVNDFGLVAPYMCELVEWLVEKLDKYIIGRYLLRVH